MTEQSRSTVNATLTSRRPGRAGRVVENTEFTAFGSRVIQAAGRRVAAGDVEALPALAALSADLDTAICNAVTGLRAAGYSWTEIAARLGVTRQAAQQRWTGHRQTGRHQTGARSGLRSALTSRQRRLIGSMRGSAAISAIFTARARTTSRSCMLPLDVSAMIMSSSLALQWSPGSCSTRHRPRALTTEPPRTTTREIPSAQVPAPPRSPLLPGTSLAGRVTCSASLIGVCPFAVL